MMANLGLVLIAMAALGTNGCRAGEANGNAQASAGNAAAVAPAKSENAIAATPAAAPADGRGVDDPRAFVEQRYAAYRNEPSSAPEWPAFAYSDRLKALFDAYDAWQRQHQDEVGSLDFDWWINAQDWELSPATVTETQQDADHRTETARFTNAGRQEELRFLFVRQGARWYLDDAVQGSGHGDDGWTLSELVRNPAG
jgi:hypothetical protein